MTTRSPGQPARVVARVVARGGHRHPDAADRGAVAVEFALLVPVFLLLIGWLIYGGYFMFLRAQAEHDVRTALRALVVSNGRPGYLTPGADTDAAIAAALSGADPDRTLLPPAAAGDITYTETCTDSAGRLSTTCAGVASGDVLRISATFHPGVLTAIRGLTLFTSPATSTVTVTASARVE